MIYDRPYMRDENKSEGYTAITVLMLINLAVYIIQHLPMAFDSKFPYEYFALTSDTLPTLKLRILSSLTFFPKGNSNSEHVTAASRRTSLDG